jgi:regulator of protease activity HflC (stomatin/prohibitin superfamily)
VERERAIAENELQNQIELARREEQLVTQHGQNARREAEESSAAERIGASGKAERRRLLASAEAEATRELGVAAGDAEAARVAAYRELEAGVLFALAAKELAAHLPDIQSLTITPDLLTPLLAKLGSSSKEASEQ